MRCMLSSQHTGTLNGSTRVPRPSARYFGASAAGRAASVVGVVQVPEPAPESIQVRTPLCEMESSHQRTLLDVMQLYSNLQQDLTDVGDALTDNDGPSADDLQV